MKRLFLFLLMAGLLFWLLGQKTRTVTLPVPAGTALSPATVPASDGILQIIIPGADMDYYSVSGATAEEIRKSLNHRHPVNGFDAHTGWHVNWSWPGFGSDDCDLAAGNLETRLRVSLPTWPPPSRPDPALVLKWNRYLGNLALHEQGHVQLARQGFAKMQQILHDSTCDEADAKLNVVLGEMRQADLRYDAETDHGSTQGAKFP